MDQILHILFGDITAPLFWANILFGLVLITVGATLYRKKTRGIICMGIGALAIIINSMQLLF